MDNVAFEARRHVAGEGPRGTAAERLHVHLLNIAASFRYMGSDQGLLLQLAELRGECTEVFTCGSVDRDLVEFSLGNHWSRA